jgi:hypothetical protein
MFFMKYVNCFHSKHYVGLYGIKTKLTNDFRPTASQIQNLVY